MLQALRESKTFQKVASWAGLFTSVGTLVCCAIPSMLVLLGLGTTVASFLGEFPQLIWPSEHKELVFGASFFMLGLSYAAQKYAATLACPIDKKADCEQTKNWSRPLFHITLAINIFGAFYAFVLPKLL